MLQEEEFEGPWRDPIVEEIRKIREEHAARFNYDVRAIGEDLMRRQHDSGHRIVSLPPRRVPVAGKPDG